MKTFIRYITLLLVGGVIIPICYLLHIPKMGTKAHGNNYEKTAQGSLLYRSVAYAVAAKILPVLHFFQ